MSRRIFQTPTLPSPSTDNGRTPDCYYHKHPITHFCTQKKCTLPLCTECLPIHKKKHIKYKQIAMEGIVDFQVARGEALKAFEERKIQIQAIQERFVERINVYRKQIEQIVSLHLAKIVEECLIQDGNAEIMNQIVDRSAEIRGGSLKEMIRFYEDSFGAEHSKKLYKMYFGDYLDKVKFQINQRSIQESITKGIMNMISNKLSKKKIEKQNLQPHKSENNQQQQFEANTLHETMIKRNKNQSQKEIVMMYEPPVVPVVDRKEEDLESEISTYKILKSKKNSAETNIYTMPAEPLISMPLSSNPSSNNISNNTSRSKSRRKKGLSLARSHQQLRLDTRGSFQSQHSSQEQHFHTSQKRSSWKNFINMGGPSRGQQVQFKAKEQRVSHIETNPVLDPRQMRQLIMKKKIEEKNRQTKTNKSVEHLSP